MGGYKFIQQNSKMNFIKAKELNTPGKLRTETHAKLSGLQYYLVDALRRKINPMITMKRIWRTLRNLGPPFLSLIKYRVEFFIHFISNDSASCRNESPGSPCSVTSCLARTTR